MLTHNQQLTAQQLSDLEKLSADCKQVDNYTTAIYTHLLKEYRPRACHLFYYHENQLIGFLSPYFFYDDACEITLMVAPKARRKGIATLMLQEALSRIQSSQLKTLIFSAPHHLNDHWLPDKGFCYQESEYQMELQLQGPVIEPQRGLLIRPATTADHSALCAIDRACFSQAGVETEARFHELLQAPNYQLVIAQKEQELIGKMHIAWQANNARFSDIAILPEHQGQGFAKAMLSHCINQCWVTHHPIIHLDVETTNQSALKLYTRLGFLISNAYDFWSIPIENSTGYSPHI